MRPVCRFALTGFLLLQLSPLFCNRADAQLHGTVFRSAKSDGADATLVQPGDWNQALVPQPDSTDYIKDSFCGHAAAAATGTIGELGWTTSGTGAVFVPAVDTDANRMCVDSMGIPATANNNSLIRLGTTGTSGQIDPAMKFDMTWIVRLNSTSTTNLVNRCGLADNASAFNTAPTDGIYFERTNGDDSWFGVTRNASTQTRTTAVAATTTSFVRLRAWRSDASTISFSVDGGTAQTSTTNIPTQDLLPYAGIGNNNTTTANQMLLDHFHIFVRGISR